MQDEQKKFQEKLSELLSYARNHENKVTMKEVRDFFEDFALDEQKVTFVCEYLTMEQVDVADYEPGVVPEETEKEMGVRFASLEELMSRSDVVSIHCPLLESTKGMINAALIGKMKSSAILINTARGGVVDEQSLAQALREKKIRGAGIDSYTVEPIPADHPFLSLDNCVLTSHNGGGVIDNVVPVTRHAFENIQKFSLGIAMDPRDVIVPRK